MVDFMPMVVVFEVYLCVVFIACVFSHIGFAEAPNADTCIPMDVYYADVKLTAERSSSPNSHVVVRPSTTATTVVYLFLSSQPVVHDSIMKLYRKPPFGFLLLAVLLALWAVVGVQSFVMGATVTTSLTSMLIAPPSSSPPRGSGILRSRHSHNRPALYPISISTIPILSPSSRGRAKLLSLITSTSLYGGSKEDLPPPPTDDETLSSSPTSTEEASLSVQSTPGIWPCMDDLDKKLIKVSLPVIGNYAIGPMIGAVDLFWVNRMGNVLAVAGQAAANQVFSSVFWFTSFLPSVTATLVSKQHAKGNNDGTRDAICQALYVGFFIAMVLTPLMFFFPNQALGSVLSEGSPAMKYAKPYLLIRSFAFLPSLVSLVGFSAFRGILDTRTPVRVSLFANAFNAVLDPILIFSLSMGVPGAALATLAAEIISAAVYITLLRRRYDIGWARLFTPPKWSSLTPLLRGGAALQLRNLSLNLTFLAVARVTQSIDQTGVAAAAHAMAIQTFQIGGIVLLALSTVAQTVVPNAMVQRHDDESGTVIGGMEYAKATVNRLMSWGLVLGCMLGSLQLLLLPAIQRATPLQEVRDAARLPAIIASVLQAINGLVFIGEGVMIGTGSFLQLSLSTLAATLGCLGALYYFPPIIGLTGVWVGFGVWNFIRLAGVWIHQTVHGPLSTRTLRNNASPGENE